MGVDASQAADVPLVTIGVPLFNEGAFLESALDSLIAQDYPNIEIVISDNASDDDTQSISRIYASGDPRISYHRLPENAGAAFNSNHIIELASGEYFMRASGHDRWSPNYVSSCMDELTRRPEAVIAFGSTEWIDEGDLPYPKETGWTDTRGMSTLERFFTQLWGNMHPIMGVARTECIRRVLPFTDMASADLAFLLELSLMGDFAHVPTATWFRRETRGPHSYQQRMERYRSDDLGLIGSGVGGLVPYGRLLWRVPGVIMRSRVSLLEKIIMLLLLYPTAAGRYVAARKRHGEQYRRERAGS